MPPWIWAFEPTEAIREYENRHKQPEAGALLQWARITVESLHYLADVDAMLDTGRLPVEGHNLDVADVSHARWATGGSITAVDLCAAAFGRAYCGQSGGRQLDLRNFDLGTGKRAEKLRSQLPADARAWLDDVFADIRYSEIKTARDALVHRRVLRHFAVGSSGRKRLEIETPKNRLPVRLLVERATAFATERVAALFGILPSI